MMATWRRAYGWRTPFCIDFAFRGRIAQQIGGVIGGDQFRAAKIKPLAAKSRDALIGGEQRLSRTCAEAANHFWLDGGKLAQQERGADADFVLVGQAIFGRAAFHHVADVNILAAERHRFDHLGEKFSRAAYKRLALHVFIVAGAFADENQLGFGIANAEYELRAAFVQAAARAFAEVGANVVESFAGHTFGGFKQRGAGRRGNNGQR